MGLSHLKVMIPFCRIIKEGRRDCISLNPDNMLKTMLVILETKAFLKKVIPS
jgi:hypothetical protein